MGLKLKKLLERLHELSDEEQRQKTASALAMLQLAPTVPPSMAESTPARHRASPTTDDRFQRTQ